MSVSYENGEYEQKFKASYQESLGKEDDFDVLRAEYSIGARKGVYSASAEAKCGTSVFSHKDEDGEVKLLSWGAGVNAGADPTSAKYKIKAGVNLIEVEAGSIKTNLGYNVDTGGSIGSDGIEAKVAGFGAKFGKETGFSTPFGGFSVDLEKLVTSFLD